MAFIFYKCKNQPSFCRQVSDPRQDLGTLGPPGENDQASVHRGPAQSSPRYIPGKVALRLDRMLSLGQLTEGRHSV